MSTSKTRPQFVDVDELRAVIEFPPTGEGVTLMALEELCERLRAAGAAGGLAVTARQTARGDHGTLIGPIVLEAVQTRPRRDRSGAVMVSIAVADGGS